MSYYNEPKTERGQETLNSLLKAAEEIFGEKGYYNTSIIDITQRAGVAQGTFYIYFPNKKAIFQALILDLSHTLRKEIAISIKNAKNRMEAERTGFRTFFSFINRHSDLYKIVWEAQFVDPDLFRAYYQKIAKGYSDGLANAIKKGEIKDLDTEMLAYSLIGIANFVGLRWIIWEKTQVPEKAFDDMMAFITSGMKKH
ncbi:MAG TPA: TetR/AcrR family transcriptional regulator [Thermoanaerobacterales bacterium]|nr:TetR/AcrR family transcriptional regulator [Thermoanaerobacterales bacterium]